MKTTLGVEGGGTKTEWLLLRVAEHDTYVTAQGVLPPANYRLIKPQQLKQLLRTLPADITHCGVYLAGCVTIEDRKQLCEFARQIWPSAHVSVGSDRESGFAAAFGNEDGIAVISGTGSAVTGRKNDAVEHAGGRGHLLGDRGGAYVICIEGLRLALRSYDLQHQTTPVANNILKALGLKHMEDLIAWTQSADKMAISELAPVMFAAALNGDQQMMSIIAAGATSLAEYARSVAHWLQFESPHVKLSGGLFLQQSMYVELFKKALTKFMQFSAIEVTAIPGALGAALLAAGEVKPLCESSYSEQAPVELNGYSADSVTEARHPYSGEIDSLTTQQLVELFVEEEVSVLTALQSARQQLENAVDAIYEALSRNGRLFYVGAGTSGRLGVLDASEIPPTFGEPPQRVQAIIAGGPQALHRSVEGAEDSQQDGKKAIAESGVTSNDVVCGITASGRTPFVLAALSEAKRLGAKTLLITSNQNPSNDNIDVAVSLVTGPELIAGSTRLKAGTATKVALNILTTCTMVKLGKIKGNLMIDLQPSNEKLKARAIRIVSTLKGCSQDEAKELLIRAGWNIRAALTL